MSPPTVSIIINNFNYARYLEACIHSALSQTYPAIEIIVVDDGSTDGSRALLEQYANRARIILRENGGQAAAFNSGFAQCSGELVSFLDADDTLCPDAIATVVTHWRGEYAKLQFPLRILDSQDRATPLLMPRLPVSAGDVRPTFLKTGRYVSAPTSGNVFNREFLKQVLPIPESAWAKTADGYLNNCAPFYGTIGALHEPLGHYRVHGESMSSVISKGKLNLATAKQLMENGLCEKRLIQEMARAHNVDVSPHVVTSHWMFLKLKVTVEKERCRRHAWGYFSKDLFGSGGLMARSIWCSRELAPLKKVQHLCWTLWMVIMPWSLCQRVIRYAFETAPSTTLSLTLRQL
jgi:glycosyltransferase involved in cell wall biosynthesis